MNHHRGAPGQSGLFRPEDEAALLGLAAACARIWCCGGNRCWHRHPGEEGKLAPVHLTAFLLPERASGNARTGEHEARVGCC